MSSIIVKECLICLQEYEGEEEVLEGFCPDCDVHDEMNEQYRKDIKDGII